MLSTTHDPTITVIPSTEFYSATSSKVPTNPLTSTESSTEVKTSVSITKVPSIQTEDFTNKFLTSKLLSTTVNGAPTADETNAEIPKSTSATTEEKLSTSQVPTTSKSTLTVSGGTPFVISSFSSTKYSITTKETTLAIMTSSIATVTIVPTIATTTKAHSTANPSFTNVHPEGLTTTLNPISTETPTKNSATEELITTESTTVEKSSEALITFFTLTESQTVFATKETTPLTKETTEMLGEHISNQLFSTSSITVTEMNTKKSSSTTTTGVPNPGNYNIQL